MSGTILGIGSYSGQNHAPTHPSNVHILIPRTREYINLHTQKGLWIVVKDLAAEGLSWIVQVNTTFLKSHESFKVENLSWLRSEGNANSEKRHGQLLCPWLWKWRKQSRDKECGWALEAGRNKKRILSWGLQNGKQPCLQLDVHSVRPMLDLGSTELYTNKFCVVSVTKFVATF